MRVYVLAAPVWPVPRCGERCVCLVCVCRVTCACSLVCCGRRRSARPVCVWANECDGYNLFSGRLFTLHQLAHATSIHATAIRVTEHVQLYTAFVSPIPWYRTHRSVVSHITTLLSIELLSLTSSTMATARGRARTATTPPPRKGPSQAPSTSWVSSLDSSRQHGACCVRWGGAGRRWAWRASG